MNRKLLLLILLCGGLSAGQTAGLPGPRRASRAVVTPTPAVFRFAAQFNPFGVQAGLPTTSCNLLVTPTGTLGEPITDARSSVANCPTSDGQQWIEFAANTLRVTTGAINTSMMGALIEGEAATNAIWPSRNTTTTSGRWVATGMTCTQTATGMRNDVNGASLCVTSAPNATLCQQLTKAAAVRATSMELKGMNVTGAFTATRNGSTYTSSFQSSMSLTRWRRLVPSDTTGCAGGDCIIRSEMTSSVLNPNICIKVANAGDAFAIDMVQDEVGDIATSPVVTTAGEATRTAETVYATVTSHVPQSISIAFQTNGYLAAFKSPMGVWQDATNVVQMWTDANPGMNCINYHSGSLTTYATFFFAPISAASFTQWGCEYASGATVTAYQRGIPYSQASAFSAPAAATRVYFGGGPIAGSLSMPGVVRDVCSGTLGTCITSTFSSEGSNIAVNGDSITLGVQQLPTRWAQQLNVLQNRAVFNIGNTGLSAQVCLDNFRNYVRNHGYTSMTSLCGVNSLIAGDSAATTFATLQTLYDEVQAAGIRLTIGTLTPWKGSALSDAAKQTQTLLLNTSIRNYCTTTGVTCVDFYNSVLNDGLGNLSLTYADADLLHPNAAGGVAMGVLWNAANP